MSQNTVVIIDGTGLEVLGYMNDAFNTLITNNSGATAPTETYANMFWADTSGAETVLKMRNDTNDAWVTLMTVTPGQELVARTSSTGSIIISAGTEAQRDGSPAAGYFRFNTDLGKFEGYNGTSWGSVGGGATGGGADEVFIENSQTVTEDYTITTGKNAGSFGPITIADGVTVTVPTGSVWSIV